MERQRVEGFSDGVFAVAITLLALDLAVAGPGHGGLVSQLGHHWPAFVAYVISFFTIGIIWVNHHALVSNLAVVDRMLMFLNLLLLLFVVALPFATATMAEYLARGGQDSHVAMALYGAICEGMSLGFAVVFEWSLRDGHAIHVVPAESRHLARLRFGAGLTIYAIAIGVAFVSPDASLAIIGITAVYYVVERTPRPDATHAELTADSAGSGEP